MPAEIQTKPAPWRSGAQVPWLWAPCEWAAFGIPFFLGVLRLDGAPRWASDVHAVRALGLVQVGAEGVVSGALGALCSLLPLGGRLFRVGLVSALAAGLATLLLFRLAAGARPELARPLRVMLALAAALGAALSTDWRLAGAAVGGPMTALVLLLYSLTAPLGSRASWALQGATIGVCVAENHALALAMLLSVFARAALRDSLPTLSKLSWAAASLAGAAVICLLPAVLERFSSAPSLNLGFELGLPGSQPSAPPLPLVSEIGPYTAALSALGVVAALLRPGERRVFVPALLWIGLSVLLDGAALRLAGIAGVAVLAASGAWFAVTWLQDRRLPFARLGLRLLFVLHIGALLLGAEQARQELDRRSLTAAGSWTDEAFERLPAGALLLAQTPAVAWRYWAASATYGLRPDVLLVPRPLLVRGRVSSQLLQAEPKLAPLIRDAAIDGAAGEFALSQLADERPLRVELNPEWDRRLVAHLKPERQWLSFAPHAVGESDRLKGISNAKHSSRKILKQARQRRGADWATIARVQRSLYQNGAAMTVVGDRASASAMISQLSHIAPGSPETERLVEQLNKRNTGYSARAPLQ